MGAAALVREALGSLALTGSLVRTTLLGCIALAAAGWLAGGAGTLLSGPAGLTAVTALVLEYRVQRLLRVARRAA